MLSRLPAPNSCLEKNSCISHPPRRRFHVPNILHDDSHDTNALRLWQTMEDGPSRLVTALKTNAELWGPILLTLHDLPKAWRPYTAVCVFWWHWNLDPRWQFSNFLQQLQQIAKAIGRTHVVWTLWVVLCSSISSLRWISILGGGFNPNWGIPAKGWKSETTPRFGGWLGSPGMQRIRYQASRRQKHVVAFNSGKNLRP